MAVLAGLAKFGVLERYVTAAQLQQHHRALVLAILGLYAVAVLDVVVAWALWAFLDHAGHAIALTAAWLRTVYAAIFAAAITHLVVAAIRQDSGAALAQVGQFQRLWHLGLILFGIHLLVIGWLAWRSGTVPRAVAALVAIAGAGYLADSVSAAKVSTVTFIGEVVLMGWLLIHAMKSGGRPRTTPNREPAKQLQPI